MVGCRHFVSVLEVMRRDVGLVIRFSEEVAWGSGQCKGALLLKQQVNLSKVVARACCCPGW